MRVTDGLAYVKVKVNSWTLMQVVVSEKLEAPFSGRAAQGKSLSCCNGLASLVQLRNDAQAAQLSQGGSTLFSDSNVKAKKQKQPGLKFKLREISMKPSPFRSQWMA